MSGIFRTDAPGQSVELQSHNELEQNSLHLVPSILNSPKVREAIDEEKEAARKFKLSDVIKWSTSGLNRAKPKAINRQLVKRIGIIT